MAESVQTLRLEGSYAAMVRAAPWRHSQLRDSRSDSGAATRQDSGPFSMATEHVARGGGGGVPAVSVESGGMAGRAGRAGRMAHRAACRGAAWGAPRAPSAPQTRPPRASSSGPAQPSQPPDSAQHRRRHGPRGLGGIAVLSADAGGMLGRLALSPRHT